ncbi:MAG: 50S ribosomal protein L9 [Chloroflexota bacterium]
MKIVLLQDVHNVGRAGEVKNVADGYARNYLMPRGLALQATPGAVKVAEMQKRAAALRQARTEVELAELAANIEGKVVEVVVKAGAKERIYGSVTSRDIAQALAELTGFDIDKKRVEMEKPIHELGTFTATVKLSASLAPKVTINVKRE